MTYPIYREPPSPRNLCQGDILDPECLCENLKGHQDYFAERPHFYRYMIVTQTCDLVSDREISDFIFLSVVRRLSEAFGRRHVENRRARDRTKQLLSDLLNHNYNKRGFFYLPKDERQSIDEDSVVDLRVMFSLHKSHYQDLLNARRGAITDVYAAQLGHMVGYMFSRIATPGWDELNPGQELSEETKRLVNDIHEREEAKFKELMTKAEESACAVSQCSASAETYRWLPMAEVNGETEHQAHILCLEHAKQYDEGSLPEGTIIRSEI